MNDHLLKNPFVVCINVNLIYLNFNNNMLQSLCLTFVDDKHDETIHLLCIYLVVY